MSTPSLNLLKQEQLQLAKASFRDLLKQEQLQLAKASFRDL